MYVLIGDELKCKKEVGTIIKKGEICTVEDIGDGFITFRFGTYHKGMMSLDECNKHFSKARYWSKWQDNNSFEYRTNGKTVQVRYKNVKYGVCKGSCTCHEDDIFDLKKGIDLARLRALKVLIERAEEKCKREM